MLNQWLVNHDISLDALKRIRHRVFVVGRFNQSKKGQAFPDLYLFTNRPQKDLPEDYHANFTDVRDLRYESFVRCLKPALAEEIEYSNQDPNRAIPIIKQIRPRSGDEEEGAAVLDVFDFLFQRATSTTVQPWLRAHRPSLPGGMTGVGGLHAGEGIFGLIRHNLSTFSKFQTRTYEVVAAFSRLMERCARYRGLPHYADGHPLPAGFPEKLIDFVYSEDQTQTFNSEGLDFSRSPWDELTRGDKGIQGMESFCWVVTAFRDALLESKREQFGLLRPRNRTLKQHSQEVLSAFPDLTKDFNKAREAYNTLRQLLRSKALISMVLEWVLSGYNEVKAVKELGPSVATSVKHSAIENAILVDWKANRLPEPVRRPSLEEREQFRKDLTSNFDRLVSILTSGAPVKKGQPGAERSPRTEAFDPETTAERIRREHPQWVQALNLMIASSDSESRVAFIEGFKIVLLDVLCPVLFQDPRLGEDELQDDFEKQTLKVYLAAVCMAPESKEAIRKIGQKNLEYFQQSIVDEVITRKGAVLDGLFDDIFELISSAEIQRRVVEGLRVLKEAHALLRVAPRGASAAAISAVRPDPHFVTATTIEKTESQPQGVKASIQSIVEKMVTGAVGKETVTETVDSSKGAASGGGASSGKSSASGAATGGGGSSAGAPPPGAAGAQQPGVVRDISAMVDKVIGRFFAENSGATLQNDDVEKLVKQATAELLDDDGFMGRVRKDVRAFEQVLYLIYQRYNENTDKKEFRSQVERLTLINSMLLFRDELSLGTASSGLYRLLLDLVLVMDPENPNPEQFIKQRSLTLYFDNAKLQDGGITNLLEILDVQRDQNLQETQGFVSELWGVKYLIERVSGDSLAEVVVVNATADEFLDWVKADNLDGPGPLVKGRLRPAKLVNAARAYDNSLHPGLVYLTDAAFLGSTKTDFLGKLANFELRSEGLGVLLPPLCISTSFMDEQGEWKTYASGWAEAAEAVPAPVVIVGPSPFLNKPSDHFRTFLPAGYLLCAHFLGQPEQAVKIDDVNMASQGRFRVIGYGEQPMKESLDRSMWGEAGDSYAFAVDYYLYLVLSLRATGAWRGVAPQNPAALTLADRAEIAQFWGHFHRPDLGIQTWESSSAINNATVDGNALAFSMAEPIAVDIDLTGVRLAKAGITGRSAIRLVNDVSWFNLVRDKAWLP